MYALSGRSKATIRGVSEGGTETPSGQQQTSHPCLESDDKSHAVLSWLIENISKQLQNSCRLDNKTGVSTVQRTVEVDLTRKKPSKLLKGWPPRHALHYLRRRCDNPLSLSKSKSSCTW